MPVYSIPEYKIAGGIDVTGGKMSNVVKLTIFIKGSEMGNFSHFSKVRGEYLVEPYPAASAIGVECLVSPEMLVEVEAFAVLD